MSTRWVITEKQYSDGSKRPKARLVVRGFEEREDTQKDAPTASKTSLRIAFGFACDKGWEIETIDVKAAFLQSRCIERDVYVTPPIEAKTNNQLWRLRKPVYGLIDAARSWFLSLKDELIKCGCKQSRLDKAVFRWTDNNILEGIFVLHVDDFLITGSIKFFNAVGGHIITKYIIGKRKNGHFEYVGLKISKTSSRITVDQNAYAEEIEIPNFNVKGRKNDSKVTQAELHDLRCIVGQVQWVSSQTRPDLSYDALEHRKK